MGGTRMKNKFWFLTSYTFGIIKKSLLLIAGLMVLAETAALFITASPKRGAYIFLTSEYRFDSYENMLDAALIPLIFAFSVTAIIIVLALKFRSFYSKQGGIYSLYTLPIKRAHILYSNILVAFSTVLFLVVVQLILVMILYHPTESLANSAKMFEPGLYGDNVPVFRTSMDNGLFLAFMRSYFLRLLLPVDFEGMLISISIVLTCAVIPTYAFSTYFDFTVGFRAVAGLIPTIAVLSYLFINGSGFGLISALILLVINIFWILTVLNQYKKSTMLYRGAK